jgi:hypothetical protein
LPRDIVVSVFSLNKNGVEMPKKMMIQIPISDRLSFWKGENSSPILSFLITPEIIRRTSGGKSNQRAYEFEPSVLKSAKNKPE